MKSDELKSIVNKAQEAVRDIEDDALKKIAFQKVLDSLLTPLPIVNQVSPTLENKDTQTSTKGLSPTIPKNMSELFAQKNPKSSRDVAVTIAYSFHFSGDGDFTVNDLNKAHKELLIPVPRNPTDVINKNILKRFLMKVDKKKNNKQAYHITQSGIDYVNSNYQSKSKVIIPKRKPKKKKEEKNESTQE